MVEVKAPTLNGFPCEFYKTYWDLVGLDLYKVYIESFRSSSIGLIINKDNIKFIPKQGYLNTIPN